MGDRVQAQPDQAVAFAKAYLERTDALLWISENMPGSQLENFISIYFPKITPDERKRGMAIAVELMVADVVYREVCGQDEGER